MTDSPRITDLRRRPEYKERIDYVYVSSVDRDVTAYPKTNHYRINFDNFKNVKSVTMVSATIPNQNSVLNNPLVLVQVEEINHIRFGTTCGINKGFSLLPLKGPTQASDGFIVPELACNYNSPVYYRTPLAKLNSFTISLVDINGDLIDFGEAGGSVALKYQNAFMFKIVTMEVCDQFNQSNVY